MIEAKILAALIDALAVVESSGRADAVNGDAVGILQIRPCVVVECNRIAMREKWKIGGKDDCRLNPWASKVIAMEYLLEKADDDMTTADMAMLWLHGKTGMKRERTAEDYEYIRRVEEAMRRRI